VFPAPLFYMPPALVMVGSIPHKKISIFIRIEGILLRTFVEKQTRPGVLLHLSDDSRHRPLICPKLTLFSSSFSTILTFSAAKTDTLPHPWKCWHCAGGAEHWQHPTEPLHISSKKEGDDDSDKTHTIFIASDELCEVFYRAIVVKYTHDSVTVRYPEWPSYPVEKFSLNDRRIWRGNLLKAAWHFNEDDKSLQPKSRVLTFKEVEKEQNTAINRINDGNNESPVDGGEDTAVETGNNAVPSVPLRASTATEDVSTKKKKKKKMKRKLEELEISKNLGHDGKKKNKHIAPAAAAVAAADEEEKEDVDNEHIEEGDIGDGGFGDFYRDDDDDDNNDNTKGGTGAASDGGAFGSGPNANGHGHGGSYSGGGGSGNEGIIEEGAGTGADPGRRDGIKQANSQIIQASRSNTGLPTRTILVAKRLTSTDISRRDAISLPRAPVETNLSFAVQAAGQSCLLPLLEYASTPSKTWEVYLKTTKDNRYVLSFDGEYTKHHGLKVNNVVAISKSIENGKLFIEHNTEEAYRAVDMQHIKSAPSPDISNVQVHRICPSFRSTAAGGGSGAAVNGAAEVDIYSTSPGLKTQKTVLIAKKLTASDVDRGIVILPRAAVEENLSFAINGTTHALVVRDSRYKSWTFPLQSRLRRGNTKVCTLSKVSTYIQHYRLKVNDVIGILCDNENGEFLIEHNTPEVRRNAKVVQKADVAAGRWINIEQQQLQQQQQQQQQISKEHASLHSAEGTATPPPTQSLQIDDKEHKSNSDGSGSRGVSEGKTGIVPAAVTIGDAFSPPPRNDIVDDVEVVHLTAAESPAVQIITAGDQEILIPKPSSALWNGFDAAGGGESAEGLAAGLRRLFDVGGGLGLGLGNSGINGSGPRLPVLPKNKFKSAPTSTAALAVLQPPPGAASAAPAAAAPTAFTKQQRQHVQQRQQQQFTPLRIRSRPAVAPTAAAPSSSPQKQPPPPVATTTTPPGASIHVVSNTN